MDAGLTVATAFDPCAHIGGVGRVFVERRKRLVSRGLNEDLASEQTMASFKSVRVDRPTAAMPQTGYRRRSGEGARSSQRGNRIRQGPAILERLWRAARGSSLLIYSR